MAKLYFRYGAMNSGKPTALIQVAHNDEERGQRVLIVKPAIDTKSPAVQSRIGVDRTVDLVAGPEVDVRARILARDFRTRGFPGSIRLMEIAHSIEELKTICRCGRKAILNARTVGGRFTQSGEQVAIDGNVGYESMCGGCCIRQFDWPASWKLQASWKLKVVAATSPIHCHSGTVPPISAPAMKLPSSSFLACTQIGQTRYRPPARS